MSIRKHHSSDEPEVPPAPEAATSAPLGITFHRRGGEIRFLPHPFLTAVDLIGTTQIVFRYTHCIVTVKGRLLHHYLPLLESMRLRRLEEQNETADQRGVPIVESIQIQDDIPATIATSFPDVPLPY